MKRKFDLASLDQTLLWCAVLLIALITIMFFYTLAHATDATCQERADLLAFRENDRVAYRRWSIENARCYRQHERERRMYLFEPRVRPLER